MRKVLCRLALAADRLLDHAVADGLGADLDTDDAAVHDGADLLDVGLELARGDAGRLGPDAAEVLRLAAMGLLIAEAVLLTGKKATAGKKPPPGVPGKLGPKRRGEALTDCKRRSLF